MTYYNAKVIESSFEKAEEQVREKLSKVGFGVLTEINLQEKFNEKLGVDFRRYKILGACNPQFAYQAVKLEDKIGTLLPCNVVIQELDNSKIEISVINPIASMTVVDNKEVEEIANDVTILLRNFIESID
ncbi:DUF302 domain-containing protein [Marinifilum sp.]|uniref:DUF302 domain-containing protein n=1 Tax=Marinifilum sp. TaxID=2033137 RepID=UPI003BA8ED52